MVFELVEVEDLWDRQVGVKVVGATQYHIKSVYRAKLRIAMRQELYHDVSET